MNEELILAKGKLLYFTEGDYSDFMVIGTFIALADITRAKMNEIIQLAAELSIGPHGIPDQDKTRDKIMPLMLTAKLIEEVENKEFHLNPYGDNFLFDLSIQRSVKGETHE